MADCCGFQQSPKKFRLVFLGAGLQWSNLASSYSPNDGLTMLHIYFMFIFDTVLYSVITWYMEKAFPGEYGIPQPWYFPFMVS